MYLILGRRKILVGFLVLFFFIGLCAFLFQVGSAAKTSVTDWGLSFKQEGSPPVGNATPEYLAEFGAYFLGNTEEKKIYLTFDAGYERGYTETILDVLKKHQITAAFFVTGSYQEDYPDLVRRMVAEGHVVGNHTYSHPNMSEISDESAFLQELQKNEAIFQEITGQEMQKFYRPPQGKFSEDNLSMARKLGYKTIFWSLAHVDWYADDQPTHEEALQKLNSRIHNGAIVLLHNTSKTNCEILDELLTGWEKEGYVFASLTELGEIES